MGELTIRGTNLNHLLSRARALTSDAAALSDLFAKEEDLLNRKRMVSQLIELRSTVLRQLQAVKDMEDTARYSHNRTDIEISAARLAIGAVIKLTSQGDESASAVGGHFLKKPAATQRPFGRVFVCIDSRGVPDGVGVVSVSRIARASNRDESAVISELRERGLLLFGEIHFSLMLDKLIEDIKAGRLRLPLPPEELPEIRYQVVYNPGAEKAD